MADTSLGLPENIEGLLAYSLGFITGGIILAVEKTNSTIRFHAMQSIMFSLSLFILQIILSFIPIVGWLLMIPVGLSGLCAWVFLMFKAFTGNKFKLPVIGDMAEKQIGS